MYHVNFALGGMTRWRITPSCEMQSVISKESCRETLKKKLKYLNFMQTKQKSRFIKWF